MHFHLHVAVLLLLPALFSPPEPKPLIPLPPPVLISPANGAMMDNGCQDRSNGITWDFDWSDVPGATQYHIRVWRNPALPLVNDSSVASSSYHYDSPDSFIINSNATGWRWRVRARVRGVWGPWSRVRWFRVERLNTDCP